MYVQLLRPEEVAKLDYNAFDATKIWDGIAETKLGTMTLNRVPENFFQSTELAAFSPGVMVPGIEASPEHLAEVEDRLATIDRLKRKHGPTLEDVINALVAQGLNPAAVWQLINSQLGPALERRDLARRRRRLRLNKRRRILR